MSSVTGGGGGGGGGGALVSPIRLDINISSPDGRQTQIWMNEAFLFFFSRMFVLTNHVAGGGDL